MASHTKVDPQATDDGEPIDTAAYLKKELYQRVQTEPDLFDFIQKAALDGLWYVLQTDATCCSAQKGKIDATASVSLELRCL
jgi:hypothetical protein